MSLWKDPIDMIVHRKSKIQERAKTAAPAFKTVEAGVPVFPLSKLTTPTIIKAREALTRRWYWITRNDSSREASLRLRARLL